MASSPSRKKLYEDFVSLTYFHLCFLQTEDQILLLQNSWAELTSLGAIWRSRFTPGVIQLSFGKTIDLQKSREMDHEEVREGGGEPGEDGGGGRGTGRREGSEERKDGEGVGRARRRGGRREKGLGQIRDE